MHGFNISPSISKRISTMAEKTVRTKNDTSWDFTVPSISNHSFTVRHIGILHSDRPMIFAAVLQCDPFPPVNIPFYRCNPLANTAHIRAGFNLCCLLTNTVLQCGPFPIHTILQCNPLAKYSLTFCIRTGF
jgi:hypothetical protein